MRNIILKLLACLLCAAILMSTSVTVFADADGAAPEDAPEVTDEAAPEADADSETEADSDAEAPEGEAEEEEEEPRVYVPTDEEAIANCKVAAENDSFILYYDEGVYDKENDIEEALERIGLYVKATGKIYWTTPLDALNDSVATGNNRKNRMSNLAYKYGNATDLIQSSAFLYSYRQATENGKTEFETTDNGLIVTYNALSTAGAVVPVHFELEDDALYVYIDTKEINERNGYKEGVDDQEADTDTIVLTEVALTPYMGAVNDEGEGYMFVPDGSGAIINLNNGKGNYSDYSQYVYNRDITQVREVEPDMCEQAYLPIMAMVTGKDGLVMIATDGDTFASANANVSHSKTENSSYNDCYFSFTLRSTDNYYMTGDSSAIMVFEKGDGTIAVDRIGVKYFPITAKGDTVTYGEIADVYRNYLIEEEGLTQQPGASEPALYIDFYGGTRKSKSILGVPVGIKTAFTPFDEATEIVDTLRESGADSIVVNYNDWTEDSMDPKIDTGDSVASVLGGKGAYKKMIKAFNDSGVDYYATVSGITFESNGNGFWTLFNTAYRVSKSYSRQYTYNIAYGTPDSGIAPALLSPRSIEKLSNKVTKNLSKFDQGAGLGLVSTTLWSDFSNKYRTNRSATAKYITDYYEAANEACGKTIADSPNAFLIPHVTRIKNLTLQSSQYKLIDVDIPFYQMVIHGYVDYSCEAINGTPDTTIAVLKAIAAGSNIHFDFISEEATELVNTDYVNLFYCTAEGWLDEAAKAYQLVSEVLTPAAGATISDYKVENDGKLLTTTYSNGYETVVDLDARTVKAGGKTYSYAEYVKGGSK